MIQAGLELPTQSKVTSNFQHFSCAETLLSAGNRGIYIYTSLYIYGSVFVFESGSLFVTYTEIEFSCDPGGPNSM